MADDPATLRALLEELDRGYLRAAERQDVRWFAEHLAEDFMASDPDGSLVDKCGFLERVARPYPGRGLRAQDVRVRFIGILALVHAGFRYVRADGSVGRGRSTNAWASRAGRWLCVSAHFNRF